MTFLYGWLIMGIFTLIIDGVMMYRRSAGLCGPKAKARFDASVEKFGGLRRLTMIRIAWGLLLPPFVLLTCVHGYVGILRDKEAG
jgi:hypothetical protein